MLSANWLFLFLCVMRIEKCWYCSGNIYPGNENRKPELLHMPATCHGIFFIRNDANIFRFCRSKCHKHFKAKHNPRKVKWTKIYRKERKKELNADTIFTFEKIRNEPIKYDRDLYIKTISAIKKIDEIKERRKMTYYENRIKEVSEKKINLSLEYIKKNPTLLKNTQYENVLNELIAQKQQHVDVTLIKDTFEDNVIIRKDKDDTIKFDADVHAITDGQREEQLRNDKHLELA
ncbi:60S ribosomal subunit protein L24, putative [Plasmodium ovale curtisi]|uniref:60S ribosomal subunit protein L24, putative n=1 Tax=Plasmodium ovale curtisi TaxID=864141 RepID=A0A1A8VVX0_PLAOA|nr:60S ribosomal subunit protein L24, putative [Plasmodium ovale curtisi]SBS93203.1 60S ribosomal subunit protein L24, putative [Plasmodium ovale curtisi]